MKRINYQLILKSLIQEMGAIIPYLRVDDERQGPLADRVSSIVSARVEDDEKYSSFLVSIGFEQ